MSKPRLIQHCTMLHEKDIFMTPDGYLALIIPGDVTLQEFVIDPKTMFTLGVDLIQGAADSMMRRIESLEDANFSLNNNLAEMERKYEGRGEDE